MYEWKIVDHVLEQVDGATYEHDCKISATWIVDNNDAVAASPRKVKRKSRKDGSCKAACKQYMQKNEELPISKAHVDASW